MGGVRLKQRSANVPVLQQDGEGEWRVTDGKRRTWWYDRAVDAVAMWNRALS